MKMFNFTGMMAPAFAPFNDDRSIKIELIPRYAQYLASQGVKGVYVNGTAGEGMSLTIPERKIVLEAWMKVAQENHLTIVAMIGAGGLKDTQNLAEHADKLGVSAIATLPCLYDKPKTVDDLVEFCYEVGLAAPNTPLLYYHIPFKTDVNIPMDEFLKCGSEKIKTLCGLKFTSEDVSGEGLRCLELFGRKFTIFTGFDNKLSESLLVGFDCAITCGFNFLAAEGEKIFLNAVESSTLRGKEREDAVNEANNQQEKLDEIFFTIFSFTNGFSVGAAKAAMKILTGIDVGPPRKPLRALPSQDYEALAFKLKPVIKLAK